MCFSLFKRFEEKELGLGFFIFICCVGEEDKREMRIPRRLNAEHTQWWGKWTLKRKTLEEGTGNFRWTISDWIYIRASVSRCSGFYISLASASLPPPFLPLIDGSSCVCLIHPSIPCRPLYCRYLMKFKRFSRQLCAVIMSWRRSSSLLQTLEQEEDEEDLNLRFLQRRERARHMEEFSSPLPLSLSSGVQLQKKGDKLWLR